MSDCRDYDFRHDVGSDYIVRSAIRPDPHPDGGCGVWLGLLCAGLIFLGVILIATHFAGPVVLR